MTKKLIGWQQSVHRARAEALQIQRDELKAESLEDTTDPRRHRGGQSTGQFVARDLDTHNVAMMAHPALAESEGVERVLSLFHDVERLAGNRTAIFDARRKASRGWLVP